MRSKKKYENKFDKGKLTLVINKLMKNECFKFWFIVFNNRCLTVLLVYKK